MDNNLPKIRCHPNQLEQVFTNLIVNSIDAMPYGGIINIVTQMENEHLLISFTDNGNGIPDTDLPKILNPFLVRKKEPVLDWVYGYAIILLLNMQEGSMSKSKLNAGTTIQITLPL